MGALYLSYFFMRALQSDWLEPPNTQNFKFPKLVFPRNCLPTPQWLLLLSPYFELCQADCLAFPGRDFSVIEGPAHLWLRDGGRN